MLTYNVYLRIIAYNYIGGQSKVAGKWQMPADGIILSGIFVLRVLFVLCILYEVLQNRNRFFLKEKWDCNWMARWRISINECRR